MRRGHQGIGGWRGENPRHFRPRNGGTPHFRPPRGFGLIDQPRFLGPRPPHGPRMFRPQSHPQGQNDNFSPEKDRNLYRWQNNQQRPPNPSHGPERRIFPLLQRMRQGQGDIPIPGNQFSDDVGFFNNQSQQNVMNNAGDIDLRQSNPPQIRDFNQRPPVWSKPPPFFEENKVPYKHYDIELTKTDYTGHRPPASDHYGGDLSSTIDNSKSFSRTVDDTVDIVRKRIQSRGSNTSDNDNQTAGQNAETTEMEPVPNRYSNFPPEQPTKKKGNRNRNIKTNCDKIKNKIVHQLFKMDKDKIHKLMDNPNSSTKFECAISSLITESQNSYNRHLRSVAEKSLTSSSSDFIHNDNNTIYEDTFMKQMQCILDPQDTVLLEDIKPMVLAELSKVLQLDDFEHRLECDEQQNFYPPMGEDSGVNQYPMNKSYDYDNYRNEPYSIEDSYYEQKPSLLYPDYLRPQTPFTSDRNRDFSEDLNDTKHIFERRKSRRESRDHSRRRRSSSSGRRHRSRKRRDSKSSDNKYSRSRTPGPQEFRRVSTPAPNEYERYDTSKTPGPHEFRRVSTPAPNDYERFDTSRTPVSHEFRRVSTPAPNEYERCDTSRTSVSHEFRRVSTPAPNEYERCDTSRTPLPHEFRRVSTPAPNEYERCETPPDFATQHTTTTTREYRRTPIPVFDANVEPCSDEDDPFAELDKQYHVAVDRNFIQCEDLFPQTQISNNVSNSPSVKPLTNLHTPEKSTPNNNDNTATPNKVHNTIKIKKEIDSQLHSLAKSPLKLFNKESNDSKEVKLEPTTTPETKSKEIITAQNSSKSQETSPDLKPVEKHVDKGTNSTAIKSATLSRKRSADEKPSHRKEKRKKSESEQIRSETNKQILNKNIIINVNDCAVKRNEKCEAPKSVFNLFFSKEKSSNNTSKENKKQDSNEKTSDKYTKRKDDKNSKKSKERESEKKTRDSISSNNSNIETSVANSSSQTPTKSDSKLKPIDMFMDQPKKPSSTRQPHKSTAPVAKCAVETIKQPPLSITRKLVKRHVSTQVILKACNKETQSVESKQSSSRFCQTERKKLVTRGTQTLPTTSKSTPKTTDAFERMKEIDMEIQTLLQEKFKLYSSLESKEGCSTNTMQSLGMAVLNVAPSNDTENETIDDAEEDAIVEDFTSIPVEELEQIAFESVQEESIETAKEKRSSRHKTLGRQRKSSLSPTPASLATSRSKRKIKPPNISLIEQIITDDRPLEDIISLDDLEALPVQNKKSSKPKSKPKKKVTKKPKVEADVTNPFDLKKCSVVLRRDNLEEMLRKLSRAKLNRNNEEGETPAVNIEMEINTKTESIEVNSKSEGVVAIDEENVVEEAVVSDIQFDMLDVSEDIVVGDNCEVKCDEKDENDTSLGSVCEEIILDNSQTSMEDATCAEFSEKNRECKVYDFSADENLRRDSTTVAGIGDAVLALECVENNFIAACLDGNVYYFNGDGQLLSTLRGSNLAVTCLTIVKEKFGTTVYTGSLDSRIRYYDLETGLEKGPECNVLSPIQTMDRAWDTIFVGTRTGFVLQFECKNNMLIPVSTVKFSDQSILALRAMKEGARKVLLVAARSESVTIKDAQTGLLLRTLEGPKMTVYSLLFEDGKVYCGTSSHQIHVFDYASGTHCGTHEGGKGAVCLRATGGLVFAGCYDGCVYVYREGESHALAQLRGPSLMLLSLAVVGSKIIAGYKDRSLYIWKIPHTILQEMIL